MSDRDWTTRMGATNKDEMCNFYVMYYVEGNKLDKGVDFDGCWNGNDVKWKKLFKVLPQNASEFNGIQYPEGKVSN